MPKNHPVVVGWFFGGLVFCYLLFSLLALLSCQITIAIKLIPIKPSHKKLYPDVSMKATIKISIELNQINQLIFLNTA